MVIDQPRVALRFFRSGIGFEQDRAQRRLTDLNLKWFGEIEAPTGGWAIIHMLEKDRVPEPRVQKVRAALPVPPEGRGVPYTQASRSASVPSRPSTPGCTASGCTKRRSATPRRLSAGPRDWCASTSPPGVAHP